MNKKLIRFIHEYFETNQTIPLHEPIFCGREIEYVEKTIKSTFVSSIGDYVDKFEQDIKAYTNASVAVSTVNGTSALHIALLLAGVKKGDLVITQPLTFVATCNAISYCGAEPIFVDVDIETLGLCPKALKNWLDENAIIDANGSCRTKKDGKKIRACVPMHTFGHPADLDNLIKVTKAWNIRLVEDAAESLGSFYKDKHTGTFGDLGIFSFNGNKIITTGGGGMILTNETLGKKAKHITTTAKIPHTYEYNHDQIAYNYRLPNINSALGCAQLEQIENFVKAKRTLARAYEDFFKETNLKFVKEKQYCRANYWLNSVICEDKKQQKELLENTNKEGIMTRPVWTLMNNLFMYQNCIKGELPNANWLESRLVNLPSSVKFCHEIS